MQHANCIKWLRCGIEAIWIDTPSPILALHNPCRVKRYKARTGNTDESIPVI